MSGFDEDPLQEPVDYRVDERGVARITLNRPHRLNAINAALVDGLVAALRQAADDEARVVVLTGAGTSFCAGHDLREPHAAYTRERADALQEVTRLMRALPGVVVAAVRGYAVGGGAEFAMGADLVVATVSARFQFPEVAVGLSATGGSTSLLPRLVGLAQAKRLMLLGDRIDGVEAERLGLVTWAVPDDDLDARVEELVDTARRPGTYRAHPGQARHRRGARQRLRGAAPARDRPPADRERDRRRGGCRRRLQLRRQPAVTPPGLSRGSGRRPADRQPGHVQRGRAVDVGDLEVEVVVDAGLEPASDGEGVREVVVVVGRVGEREGPRADRALRR